MNFSFSSSLWYQEEGRRKRERDQIQPTQTHSSKQHYARDAAVGLFLSPIWTRRGQGGKQAQYVVSRSALHCHLEAIFTCPKRLVFVFTQSPICSELYCYTVNSHFSPRGLLKSSQPTSRSIWLQIFQPTLVPYLYWLYEFTTFTLRAMNNSSKTSYTPIQKIMTQKVPSLSYSKSGPSIPTQIIQQTNLWNLRKFQKYVQQYHKNA